MEVSGTVTYPEARYDNSTAICHGVSRFAKACRGDARPMTSHVAILLITSFGLAWWAAIGSESELDLIVRLVFLAT